MPLARRRIRIAVASVALVLAYPALVLGYTWWHVFRSDLPGGANGPLDAYRHALASAVVAYTLGPAAVEFVNDVMENRESPAQRMDRHNNRIGEDIAARADGFFSLEPAVREHVLRGAENADDPLQVTWLPPRRWKARRLW